jgi:DNA primase
MLQDPWSRTAQAVQQRYVDNPDLIGDLLEKIGARNITPHARGSFRSTCPLHDGDNHQAFAVWVDKGYTVWKCHTRCAARGNLATLMMKRYQASFQEAVTRLAQFAGVKIDGPILCQSIEQIEEESLASLTRRLKTKPKTEEYIFDEGMVKQAWGWWRHPDAKRAIQFLTGPVGTLTDTGEKCKGFPREIIKKFELGFVPAKQWLQHNPAKKHRQAGELNDGWFVDRVAVPWRNRTGQCIGFAGRRLDGQKYLKYQNLPLTSRGSALYGLHLPDVREAIARTREVIVVEGYCDVLRGHQHGILNITCPGGTEFSPTQLRLLAQLGVEWINIFFDGDQAGVLTSARLADQCRDVSRIRVARLPDGVDPDDLCRREDFLGGLATARPV